MATTDKQKNTTATSKLSARERRDIERRRQQRQQTILLTVGGLVLLVLVIGAILLTAFAPIEATVTDEVKNAYAAILSKGDNYQGRTEEGYYYIGNPDAPVVIEEFSSFSCPHCADYRSNVLDNIHDKIEAGEVKLVYVPLNNFGPELPDRVNMSKAAMCAGEQGKFWQMHDMLFDWQQRYGQVAGDSRRLSTGAAALGLDSGKFDACFDGTAYNDLFAAASEQANTRGITGTPTVYLNGQKMEMNGGAISLNELRGVIESVVASQS